MEEKEKVRPKRMSTKQKIILIISGLFLCVVLLEIGLRMGGFIFLFLQEFRNRISIQQKGIYRIMCIGESTTACSDYPHLLQEALNERDMGIRFSVINKGIPAVDTSDIISRLEDNLDQYSPDMIIAMMGINDGNYIMPYEDIPGKKTKIFINSLRTYKLVKLLQLHIVDKAKEIGICKIREKKEDILDRTNDSARPDNLKDQDITFKKDIEITPNNYQIYLLNLGRYYSNRGEYDKAEEILNKAIEINPENEWVYTELGWCYYLEGKYDKAEAMFKKAIEINPGYDRAYGSLALCYKELGKYKLEEEYFRKATRLRSKYCHPRTWYSYQRLKEIVTKRGIKLVCMQYPMRSVEPLKRLFDSTKGMIFVDNEGIFKEAIRQASYDEYFNDIFGGDFGHCTPKGDRLLAENIADVILKECFNK